MSRRKFSDPQRHALKKLHDLGSASADEMQVNLNSLNALSYRGLVEKDGEWVLDIYNPRQAKWRLTKKGRDEAKGEAT